MVAALAARLVVLLACICVVLAAGADFYKVLGVSKTAGDKEVKKACESRPLPPCGTAHGVPS